MSEAGPTWICVHGHFYQPAREEPWRETVERDPSASPYHDWNERVTAECYAPNAWARILDDRGAVERLVNNYASMSFDVGPTLLSWLERERSDVYQAILEADRESQLRNGGHGGAMAQAYNHMILPLARPRDLRTQVVWGIRDFERRFGRTPEGLWLPETAVNLETLGVLAEQGIRFTVLAPHQARRVRSLSGGQWQEPPGGAIDPTRPYAVRVPGGREVVVFFYDAGLAHAVAFGDLLASGVEFARRLAAGARSTAGPGRIIHLATDGETYGHHHRFGEMGLADALRRVGRSAGLGLTTYGAFLEGFPPTEEVEIVENTSWSCVHGVERWRSDCGCTTGGEPGWSQAWRAPLRQALDALSARIGSLFEREGAAIFHDPWAARDAAADWSSEPWPANWERLLKEHGRSPLDPARERRGLALIELAHQAMLMFTSCGWFFSDLAGVETIQILRHAGRAVDLAEDLGERGLEEEFLRDLARAHSNRPEEGDGREIYERHVRPERCGLAEVAGAATLARLLGAEGARVTRSHAVELAPERPQAEPVSRDFVGSATVRSHREGGQETFWVAARDGGFGELSARVSPNESAKGPAAEPTDSLDVTPESLPKDLRRLLLELAACQEARRVLSSAAGEETSWTRLVERLARSEEPVPPEFGFVASALVTRAVVEALRADPARARALLRDAGAAGLSAISRSLERGAERALVESALAWSTAPRDSQLLRRFLAAAEIVREAFPAADRARAQWLYQVVLDRGAQDTGDQTGVAELGRALGMHIGKEEERAPRGAPATDREGER